MVCGCPTYYTYNPSTGMCELTVLDDAVYANDLLVPPNFAVSANYQSGGTVIFPLITSSQYPLTAVNTSIPSYLDHLGVAINPSNTLLSGDYWISAGSPTRGRMNMIGVGMRTSLSYQGYLAAVDVKYGEVYSLGISSIWGFNVYIDGTLAVSYNPSVSVQAYAYYQIIPLQLTLGAHTFLIESISGDLQAGSTDSWGGFVFELYKDVTPQILSSITTEVQLSSYVAKQTINGIGQNISTAILRYSPMDTGEFGNYSCTQGHLNACVDGKIVCQYESSVAPIPCCFRLTNCQTGEHFFTQTDLSSYLSNFITIEEVSGSFAITVDGACTVSIPVTVSGYYSTCAAASAVYYRLIACPGNIPDLYTTSDLSAYMNKTIKIRGYGHCWTVFAGTSGNKLTNVEVTSSFDTCQTCN